MLAQESGGWAQSSELAKQLKLPDEKVASTWFHALKWHSRQPVAGEKNHPVIGQSKINSDQVPLWIFT